MKRLKYTVIGFSLFFTWRLSGAVCVMAGYQVERDVCEKQVLEAAPLPAQEKPVTVL